MRILILGGNGFIGYNLSKFLLEKNQSIRVLTRSLNNHRPELKGVEYIYGNFGDINILKKALKGVDIVYHLISTSVPSTSNKDPINDVNTNVINTINLLQICAEIGIKKIIFTSSGGTIYGVPNYTPIDEKHPTNPICSYGITKLTIEKYLHLFYHLKALDYTVLRIANAYGPGQDPEGKIGAITIFLNHIKKGLPIHIWGDGNIVRDYIYINDIIEALYLAQNMNLSEQIFNIGDGKGTSLNDLISEIKKVIHVNIKVEYLPARNVDVLVNYLDITKAKNFLNWQPKVTLDEGIKSSWSYLLEN
jgi:UDP-glucose 4-epimerase